MKKLSVAILFLVYALSSTGAVVHLEYCCGKLADISLEAITTTDKCKKETISAKSCCDSKQIHLKVKGEQELLIKWTNSQKQSAALPFSLFSSFPRNIGPIPVESFSNGPPLRHSAIPLNILYCHLSI